MNTWLKLPKAERVCLAHGTGNTAHHGRSCIHGEPVHISARQPESLTQVGSHATTLKCHPSGHVSAIWDSSALFLNGAPNWGPSAQCLRGVSHSRVTTSYFWGLKNKDGKETCWVLSTNVVGYRKHLELRSIEVHLQILPDSRKWELGLEVQPASQLLHSTYLAIVFN